LGKISFNYKIFDNSVLINVDFSQIVKYNGKNISKICILNELGGVFFNACKSNDKLFPPPSGWVKLEGNKSKKLYSKELKTDFDLEIIEKSPNYSFDFIYGREKVSNFCWAGFDIEIDTKSIKNLKNDCNLIYVCNLNEN